ncbi:MAG: hypothetical protein ACTTKH_02145 [Treponema sp.]
MLKFDVQKVTAKKDNTNDAASSGIEVQEGDSYSFTAKVSDGKIPEHWFINDNQQDSKWDGKKVFQYKIDKKDANNEGIIEVKFTERKTNKIILKFDNTEIDASISGKGSINDGDEVKEGDSCFFGVKDHYKKTIKHW